LKEKPTTIFPHSVHILNYKAEVYIKTESGKAKLNLYGVQQELKRRYRITSN
jgi:hypothetical protein